MRAERSDAGRAAGRGYPSPRAASSAPRGRAPERGDRPDHDRLDRDPRSPQRRAPGPREAGRGGRHSGEFRRPAAGEVARDARRTGSSATSARTAPTSGPRLRGALAVLGAFLLTLAAAAADSYIGRGLGLITLVALTAGTVVAALATRRKDLLSVLVSPPLVFVAVAVVNIGLAPSATLNLPTLATLLVRGFPAMGIATGAALLVCLFRLATRR